MTKKGRKPKSVPREPNGRPQRGKDKGTPEGAARRASLARGDPQLWEYTLGRMFSHNLITQEQLDVACTYAWLYKRVCGTGSPAAMRYELGGYDLGDESIARIRERFVDAANTLNRIGLHAKTTVDNIAVFDREPRWLRPHWPWNIKPEDHREAQNLYQGLEQLLYLVKG